MRHILPVRFAVVEDRRGPVLGAAGALAVVAATVLATVKSYTWLSDCLLVVLVLALVGMILLLVSYGRSWFDDSRSKPPPLLDASSPPLDVDAQPEVPDEASQEAELAPAVPFTSLWRYTTEGMEAASVMNSFRKTVSHPGYMHDPYDPTPSHIVLVVLVPCAPLAEMPPTSQIVQAFLKLLTGGAVARLTKMLGAVEPELRWGSYASNGPLNNQAILTRPVDDDKVRPVASAILNLNDTRINFQHFRDPKRAELIVRIDYEAEPGLTLAELHALFVEALQVPDAVVAFLRDDLDIPTYDDPAVHVGLELVGGNTLEDLLDPGDVVSPPGMGRASSFPVYLLADRNGKELHLAAVDAIRGVCDYGLYIHGYEKQLDRLRDEHTSGPCSHRS